MTDSRINHLNKEICSKSSASRNMVADWLKKHQAELIDTATCLSRAKIFGAFKYLLTGTGIYCFRRNCKY